MSHQASTLKALTSLSSSSRSASKSRSPALPASSSPVSSNGDFVIWDFSSLPGLWDGSIATTTSYSTTAVGSKDGNKNNNGNSNSNAISPAVPTNPPSGPIPPDVPTEKIDNSNISSNNQITVSASPSTPLMMPPDNNNNNINSSNNNNNIPSFMNLSSSNIISIVSVTAVVTVLLLAYVFHIVRKKRKRMQIESSSHLNGIACNDSEKGLGYEGDKNDHGEYNDDPRRKKTTCEFIPPMNSTSIILSWIQTVPLMKLF